MEQEPLPLLLGAKSQHGHDLIHRFPLDDYVLRSSAVGQAAFGGNYVFIIAAPIPMALLLLAEIPVDTSALFQKLVDLAANLNRHHLSVDFDGNFHLYLPLVQILPGDDLNAWEGSGTEAG